MMWSVARNFLGWIFTRSEDRVAPRAADEGLVDAGRDGRGRPRGGVFAAVVEAPRRNPQTAKPRHQGVKAAAAAAAGRAAARVIPKALRHPAMRFQNSS